MKKLIYVAAFLAASAVSYAQGTFNGVNRVSGSLDAPVFHINGTDKLSGTGFWAQFYAGPANAAADALVAVGTPGNFRTGTGAGYIVPQGELAVAGVAAGGVATLQLRAWEGAAGSTFASASVKGASATIQSGGLGGAVPGAPAALPPNPIGLTSFSLVPEPSTIALGAIGLAALLIRRRK